jgi:hypothetical protein
MTSVRHLKVAAGAGEPDTALARRIDVISAAQAWALTLYKDDEVAAANAEQKLYDAVRRYNCALARRTKG